MEEFELSSRLGIGNGGVRAKFEAWNRKWRSLSKVPSLGIGNGKIRGKFELDLTLLFPNSKPLNLTLMSLFPFPSFEHLLEILHSRFQEL